MILSQKVWHKSINMGLEPLCQTKRFSVWRGTLVHFLGWDSTKDGGKPGCTEEKINKLYIRADDDLDNLIPLPYSAGDCVWSKTEFWKFSFLTNDSLLTFIFQLLYILHRLSTDAKLLQCCILFPTYNKGDRKYWVSCLNSKYNDAVFRFWLNIFP